MNEAMAQGAVLMLLGMGIVFSFLSLLVVALGLMSRFLKDADVSPQQPAAAAPGGTVAAADLNDPELLSAITAAVHSFRAKREEPSSKNTK